MKKIISYSLWGDTPMYNVGAVENATNAEELYPDWICRYYVGESVPSETLEKLSSKSNKEVILVKSENDWTSSTWRFLAIDDSDIVIFRDTDSRLTNRERVAVDEWLESGKPVHIMRDHPYHAVPILGGMWGAKKGILPNMRELIHDYSKGDFWQVDQNFLRDIVYPLVKDELCEHDQFFAKKPFPYPRDDKHFVGQAYAGNDKILDGNEYFVDKIKEALGESTRQRNDKK